MFRKLLCNSVIVDGLHVLSGKPAGDYFYVITQFYFRIVASLGGSIRAWQGHP